jgi:hypothetical protein
MVYGSGSTVNQTFDSRFRITKYTATATNQGANYFVMHKQYEYNSDGRIRFIKAGLNQNWSSHDRLYKYDHHGRITEALTGLEANGQTETNGNYRPYRQNNVYDAFGNVTSRQVLHWTRQVNETHSYANNRESTWIYDADGRILTSNAQTPASNENIVYIYDAAGQVTSSTRNSFPINTGEQNSSTYTWQWRDGDGQTVGQKTTKQTGTNSPVVLSEIFFIRSSVLGSFVAEVYPTSDKRRTFVYAFDNVLAVSTRAISTGNTITSASWEHRDPSNSSYAMTQVDGLAHSQQELDPTGVSVGLSNPYNQPGPEIDVNGYTYPFFGSSPYGAGCRIDGLEGNCSLALRFLSSGIGAIAPWESSGRVRYDGKIVWAFFKVYGDGYAGYVPQNARYTGNGGLAPSGSRGRPPLKRKAEGDADRRRRANDTDIGAINGATEPETELRYVGNFFNFLSPDLWGDIYLNCTPKLGKVPSPGMSQSATIMEISANTSVDPTLLAVTWGRESGFNNNDTSQGFNWNPVANKRSDGGWDVGPGQLATTVWNKSPYNEVGKRFGVGNPFGSDFSESTPFNGDPVANLYATALALNSYYGPVTGANRATVAGLHRVGQGTHSQTPQAIKDKQTRINEFNEWAGDMKNGGFDVFFGCLKDGLKKAGW